MKLKKIVQFLTDGVITITCAFAVATFIAIIYASLEYVTRTLPTLNNDITAQLFLIGVLVAIVYTSVHWIIDFIRDLAKTIKPYFIKMEGGK